MSQKTPYVQARYVVEEMIGAMFNSGAIYGWTKDEFFANYREELAAEAEEETYDIAIEPPTSIQ